MKFRKLLHPISIANTLDDNALFDLLSGELDSRLSAASDDVNALHCELLKLPIGLRAMGAVHPLDFSMALEDLGRHFGRWPSQPLADETLAGLRLLGAAEAAEIFEVALSIAREHWAFICSGEFFDSYDDSDVAKAFDPLNKRLWAILGYDGSRGKNLLEYWVPYARSCPENVCR